MGSQVPSALASKPQQLARFSGGRSNGAKGEISPLWVGLPATGSPGTQLAPDPGSQAGEDLRLGGFLQPQSLPLEDEHLKTIAHPGYKSVLGVGMQRALCLLLKVSVLHGRAGAGVVAGRTGLTVTYTDVTGHSTSLRYHFPCDQACS